MKIVFNVQKVYALTIAYMLSFLAFLNLGNAVLNRIGFYTTLDTVILYGLLLGLVCVGFFLSVMEGKAFCFDDLCVLAFFVLAFLISGLMHPENEEYLFTSWLDYSRNPVYVLFLYTLPGYYFARRLRHYEYFKQIMLIFSYAVVILSVIVYFAAKDSAAMQYMTFSYNMLTQLLFLCMYPPEKKKLLHYSMTIVGMVVFVVGGARGAMLSMIFTLALVFLLRNQNTKRSVLYGLLIVAAGIAFAFFKNQLFLLLSDLLDRYSINSRTFRLLLNGELLNDSHRMVLYTKTFANTGFLGAGVMSDRVRFGIYPHNLFLELWYHHGWLVGSVLIAAICICLGCAVRKKNRPEWMLILLMLPCGFMKLMLTGSYLNQEPAFYVLLGLCMNSLLRGRNYADTNDQYTLRSRQHR